MRFPTEHSPRPRGGGARCRSRGGLAGRHACPAVGRHRARTGGGDADVRRPGHGRPIWPRRGRLTRAASAFHQVGRHASYPTASLRGMTRSDGRTADQLRFVRFTRGWLDHAEGSVLVEFGATRVLCAASVTEGVPRWRKGSGQGWVTAEYAMLPRSTNTRSDRESIRGRIGGRTHEISRLVGRSLRAVIDYKALGENTIVLDCDVLQADGGTRTAAITGAYVALADAVTHLRKEGALAGDPLVSSVAAVSVGIVDGVPRLDLPYEEDVRAETDMNVVMTGEGSYVEVQGTAEGVAFDRAELDALLSLAEKGCADLTKLQEAALAG